MNNKPSRLKSFLRYFRRGGRRYALPWLSMRRWQKRMLLAGAALLAGFLAIIFAICADLAIELHHALMDQDPLLSLLLAPAGFALLTWLTLEFFPATQGSGIPQALAATMVNDRRVRRKLLSFKIAVTKIILTLGGLLCGASIGREGPSVQVGASVMHMLGDKRRNRHISSQDLIAAGSGAGIAAAFNTPLGGIMFALEEISRYRAFQTNSTILTTVIFAGLTSLGVLGSYTYFGQTPASLSWIESLWPVFLCGFFGGIAGGLFSRFLIASSREMPGFLGRLAIHNPLLLSALCGLLTALVGIMTGGMTYGTGYGETQMALEGTRELPLYFTLAKIFVVWLAFISRFPGGIFAPALAVGAGIGSNIALFLPPEQAAAILTLGMVAFLAGMTQTPLTSFVIVMEMTANHEMLIPLMAASVIANAFSRSVCPVPLYHSLAHATLRGVNKALKDESKSTIATPS